MNCVLDASAVLAVILDEEGADAVTPHLVGARFSTVNMSETIAKLTEYEVPPAQARHQIDRLDLEIHLFDQQHAEVTGQLRMPTKHLGLSLGDRACLALGRILDLPVLTSDRRMAESSDLLGIDVRLIR